MLKTVNKLCLVPSARSRVWIIAGRRRREALAYRARCSPCGHRPLLLFLCTWICPGLKVVLAFGSV